MPDTFIVKLARSNKTVVVERGGSILWTLLEQGIEAPFSCGGGTCSCRRITDKKPITVGTRPDPVIPVHQKSPDAFIGKIGEALSALGHVLEMTGRRVQSGQTATICSDPDSF